MCFVGLVFLNNIQAAVILFLLNIFHTSHKETETFDDCTTGVVMLGLFLPLQNA